MAGLDYGFGILHDYGALPKINPKTGQPVFNPYNSLIMPDGTVYRNEGRAPHAVEYNKNPGLAWGGPVGSMPTGPAMAAIREELARWKMQNPNVSVLSHGEADARHKAGLGPRASLTGRGLEEARWRNDLDASEGYELGPDPEFGNPVPATTGPTPETSGSRVAGYAARSSPSMGSRSMPDMTPPPRSVGLLDGIGDYLNTAVTSPLFQMGAALYGNASSGKDIGTGFMVANQASLQAQQAQAKRAELARASASATARQRLWSEVMTGTPEWAKTLPAGSLDIARTLGPEAGSAMLMNLIQSNNASWLDRAKLEEEKRKNDAGTTLANARLEEARALNEDRRLTSAQIRELNEAKLEELKVRARMREEILGPSAGTPRPPAPPAPVAPAAPPVPQPAPPPVAPRAIPQSFEGEAPRDPNIVPVQAAAPQPAPAPAQPQDEAVIQTPRGPMAPVEAKAFAQRLLALPEYRPIAEQILKDVEAIQNKGRLEKGAKTELEKSMISGGNHLSRLNEIAAEFDPRFLQIPFRANQSVAKVIESFGGTLKPETSQTLQQYASFRAKAAGNLNALLKELSGAAVSAQEYNRLLMQEPNAGTGGVLDVVMRDSPTEFKAKLESSMRGVKLAVARASYMRNALGLDDAKIAAMAQSGAISKNISLEGMPALMRRTENQMMQEARRQLPRANDDELRMQVRERMKGVFGI